MEPWQFALARSVAFSMARRCERCGYDEECIDACVDEALLVIHVYETLAN